VTATNDEALRYVISSILDFFLVGSDCFLWNTLPNSSPT